MNSWEKRLKCKFCGQLLELELTKEVIITCPKCGKRFSLNFNEAAYAVAESVSTVHYRFVADDKIEARYFNNPPLDCLEEAYQDTYELQENQTKRENPPSLLNVVKKYHDAIKMAARNLLVLHPGNLSRSQIDKIQLDPPNGRALNIKTVFDYLKHAYPSKATIIDNTYNKHKDMVERIWWVRNKSEHILYTEWKLNSKIFQDLSKNPDSPDSPPDRLKYNFVERVNHTVIEIYKFIASLRPSPPDPHDFAEIDILRI